MGHLTFTFTFIENCFTSVLKRRKAIMSPIHLSREEVSSNKLEEVINNSIIHDYTVECEGIIIFTWLLKKHVNIVLYLQNNNS